MTGLVDHNAIQEQGVENERQRKHMFYTWDMISIVKDSFTEIQM